MGNFAIKPFINCLLVMSISALRQSLTTEGVVCPPHNRPIFVTVEGTKHSGKSKMITRLQAGLGPENVRVIDRPLHTNCPDAMLEHFKTVLRDIEKGSHAVVIMKDYVLAWMVRLESNDTFGCACNTTNKNMSLFTPFLRGLPQPDISFYLEPNTNTMVGRYIKAGMLVDEDGYIYSTPRHTSELYSKYANHGYWETMVCMRQDPLTKDTDALNMITMKAIMDAPIHEMRFY